MFALTATMPSVLLTPSFKPTRRFSSHRHSIVSTIISLTLALSLDRADALVRIITLARIDGLDSIDALVISLTLDSSMNAVVCADTPVRIASTAWFTSMGRE